MIKLCTNCGKQTEFEKMYGSNKYKCKECGTHMKPCADKDCNYMISSWFYCDKCFNGGLKKVGLSVATVALAVLAVVIGGDDKKNS